MALVLLRDAQGREVIVHTSIFDAPRPRRSQGGWPAVWRRFEQEKPRGA